MAKGRWTVKGIYLAPGGKKSGSVKYKVQEVRQEAMGKDMIVHIRDVKGGRRGGFREGRTK